jgi:hypothetical protein
LQELEQRARRAFQQMQNFIWVLVVCASLLMWFARAAAAGTDIYWRECIEFQALLGLRLGLLVL